MAIKHFITKTEEAISNMQYSVSGAIYFTPDGRNIYRGDGGRPKKYSGAIFSTERPTDPVNAKLYVIGNGDDYSLDFHIGGAWQSISGGDSTNLIPLDNVWEGINTFEKEIYIQSWKVEQDGNGHLVLTGGLDKNIYVSGDVVAFSSASPPDVSWWDNMPIATTQNLGAIIVGANLTIDAQGVLNAQSGVVGGANWGEIGGTLSDQTDLWSSLNSKSNLSGGNSWSGAQTFGSQISVTSFGNSTQWNTGYTHSQINTGAPHGMWSKSVGVLSYNGGDVHINEKKLRITNTGNTNSWYLETDANGHLILTGDLDKDLHVSGEVVAFSASSPPANSWWDLMPVATDLILGGIKEGSGLSIAVDGTASVDGGGTAAIWGQISGTLSNQTDLQSALNGKTTEAWVNSRGFLTSYAETSNLQQVIARQNDYTTALNFTPNTGSLMNIDNSSCIYRTTSGGGMAFGNDDSTILGAGEALGAMKANITLTDEVVFIGGESGVRFFSFPNNNTNWSNRKEMVYGVNGTLNVPSTVTAPTFVGGLSGNASTATLASKTTVTNNTTSNIEYPLVWHNGVNNLFDTVIKLTFNPSFGRVSSYSLEAINSTLGSAYSRINASASGGNLFATDHSGNSNLGLRAYKSGNTQAYFKLGGVAIGKDTAATDLDVYGSDPRVTIETINPIGSSAIQLATPDSISNTYLISYASGSAAGRSGALKTSGYLAFHTGDLSEKMRITDSGSLTINGGSDSYGKISILSPDGSDGGGIAVRYAANGTCRFWADDNNNLRLTRGGTVGLTMDISGNTKCTGEVTAYGTSDKRLKTEIKPIANALDTIGKYNPVTFKWNDKGKALNPNKDERNNFGLIAQEVENITPELIHSVYEEYKSVDYTPIISILIAGMQEQQKQIKQLKTELYEITRRD